MSVTLGELTARYVAKQIEDKVWTKGTAANNRSCLKHFVLTIQTLTGGPDPDISEVTSNLILTAIEKRWPDTGDKSTHRTMADKVKSFFNWGLRKGYRFGDIDAFLNKTYVTPQLRKKYTTSTEVETAFKTLSSRGNWRDAYMAEWLFYSMRRGGEIARMKIKDVDFTPRGDKAPFGIYWYRDTKNQRGNRALALTETRAEILRGWLAKYAEEMGEVYSEAWHQAHAEWYLFPTRIPDGPAIEGHYRRMRLIPTRPIPRVYKVFTAIYKEIDSYEKGKSSHASRRGGMEEAYVTLEELGIPDALGVLMEQSGHTTRDIAAAYLDRDEAKRRSEVAFFKVDARQRNKTNPPTPQEAPITAESTEGAQVISFAELRSRRSAG